MENDSMLSDRQQRKPRWQPICAIDRRVLGVLAEKAKTTPDAYPLSLNAIRVGCNQKSSRFPLMTLDIDDIEESLERLRLLGAIGIVEGYGRVPKSRHYLYEWFGVDKVELAVMAELLLRGAQTVGELRGRADRMEPIANLAALQPILASLKSKGLVMPLTPEGRGHVVAHALYEPKEMGLIRSQYGPAASVEAPAVPVSADPLPVPPLPDAVVPAIEPRIIETTRRDIEELRSQLVQLRSDMDEFANEQRRLDDDVQNLKNALGE